MDGRDMHLGLGLVFWLLITVRVKSDKVLTGVFVLIFLPELDHFIDVFHLFVLFV
jgi:hypothetical protein